MLPRVKMLPRKTENSTQTQPKLPFSLDNELSTKLHKVLKEPVVLFDLTVFPDGWNPSQQRVPQQQTEQPGVQAPNNETPYVEQQQVHQFQPPSGAENSAEFLQQGNAHSLPMTPYYQNGGYPAQQMLPAAPMQPPPQMWNTQVQSQSMWNNGYCFAPNNNWHCVSSGSGMVSHDGAQAQYGPALVNDMPYGGPASASNFQYQTAPVSNIPYHVAPVNNIPYETAPSTNVLPKIPPGFEKYRLSAMNPCISAQGNGNLFYPTAGNVMMHPGSGNNTTPCSVSGNAMPYHAAPGPWLQESNFTMLSQDGQDQFVPRQLGQQQQWDQQGNVCYGSGDQCNAVPNIPQHGNQVNFQVNQQPREFGPSEQLINQYSEVVCNTPVILSIHEQGLHDKRGKGNIEYKKTMLKKRKHEKLALGMIVSAEPSTSVITHEPSANTQRSDESDEYTFGFDDPMQPTTSNHSMLDQIRQKEEPREIEKKEEESSVTVDTKSSNQSSDRVAPETQTPSRNSSRDKSNVMDPDSCAAVLKNEIAMTVTPINTVPTTPLPRTVDEIMAENVVLQMQLTSSKTVSETQTPSESRAGEAATSPTKKPDVKKNPQHLHSSSQSSNGTTFASSKYKQRDETKVMVPSITTRAMVSQFKDVKPQTFNNKEPATSAQKTVNDERVEVVDQRKIRDVNQCRAQLVQSSSHSNDKKHLETSVPLKNANDKGTVVNSVDSSNATSHAREGNSASAEKRKTEQHPNNRETKSNNAPTRISAASNSHHSTASNTSSKKQSQQPTATKVQSMEQEQSRTPMESKKQDPLAALTRKVQAVTASKKEAIPAPTKPNVIVDMKPNRPRNISTTATTGSEIEAAHSLMELQETPILRSTTALAVGKRSGNSKADSSASAYSKARKEKQPGHDFNVTTTEESEKEIGSDKASNTVVPQKAPPAKKNKSKKAKKPMVVEETEDEMLDRFYKENMALLKNKAIEEESSKQAKPVKDEIIPPDPVPRTSKPKSRIEKMREEKKEREKQEKVAEKLRLIAKKKQKNKPLAPLATPERVIPDSQVDRDVKEMRACFDVVRKKELFKVKTRSTAQQELRQSLKKQNEKNSVNEDWLKEAVGDAKIELLSYALSNLSSQTIILCVERKKDILCSTFERLDDLHHPFDINVNFNAMFYDGSVCQAGSLFLGKRLKELRVKGLNTIANVMYRAIASSEVKLWAPYLYFLSLHSGEDFERVEKEFIEWLVN